MANKSIVKEYSLDRRFDFGEAKESSNPQKIVKFVKKRAHKRYRQVNRQVNKQIVKRECMDV